MLLLASSSAVAKEARPWPSVAALAPDSADVQAAQTRLQQLGLYNGSADGSLDPQTQNALAGYQKQLGLPASGALDQRTAYALKNPARVSACTDAHLPLATCLDEASRVDGLLNRAAKHRASSKTDAAGTTTTPADETDPCADPKLQTESCLRAISQMERFLQSRDQAPQ